MADNNKGANWLSREKEIRNPFFGSSMLTCEEVTDEIPWLLFSIKQITNSMKIRFTNINPMLLNGLAGLIVGVFILHPLTMVIYLNHNSKYGFEQRVIRLITGRLGGDLSPLVNFAFHSVADCEICSILVEPSPRPVFLKEGERTMFYLRSGNLTKPLSTQETVEFLNTKKQ